MSYTGSRLGKQMGRTVRLLADGTTVSASPFTAQDKIDALAAAHRAAGGAMPPDAEAADSTGTLYLYYGFGSYGNNGYG